MTNASAQATSPEMTVKLKDLLGPAGFLDRNQAAERQTSFWNSEPLQALAMVRPKSTEEVSAILTLCHKSGQPVRVIDGGPVAGAGPDCRTLALSFERMAAVAWCRGETLFGRTCRGLRPGDGAVATCPSELADTQTSWRAMEHKYTRCRQDFGQSRGGSS